MQHPKVSVIIPVYNTASYLREAVDSITGQTLKEIEIIIVDDGSTDGSGEIAEEIAGMDNRVILIRQENRGLSGARNAGIPHAAGKYVYFMDSDDRLETDALELCFRQCEKNELDFVCFDAENMTDGQVGLSRQNYIRQGQMAPDKVWKGTALLDMEMAKGLYRSPVWLYVVRRSFMQSFFQGFYPGIIHEDHLFTVPLHLYARRAEYIPRSFFKHRIRQNSIMTARFSLRNIEGYAVTARGLRQLATRHQEWSSLLDRFLCMMLDAVVWEAHRLRFSEKWQTFRLFISEGWRRYVRGRTWIVFWLKKDKRSE